MRSYLNLVITILVNIGMVVGANAADEKTSGPGKVRLNADYQISGPYSCKNLAVYLIHGKAVIKGKRFISLTEALEKGVVTIHETGDVNHLSAKNHSHAEFVFIQSGDIVKGGRQDRTLSQDVILPPKSKKIVLDSFCVEQGRWSKRGKEKSDQFSSSKKRLSSKELKLAAKKAKSQHAVWKAVETEQEQLSRTIGKSVRNNASATSLQLSLEDKTVAKKCREYQRVLLPIGQQEKDVIGFAFAINGQFNTADIYGDIVLFQKLWPKLIETAAYEAISLYNGKKAYAPVEINDVKNHILEALNSRKQKESSSRMTKRMTGETKNNYAFETKDEKDQIIHLNIIKK